MRTHYARHPRPRRQPRCAEGCCPLGGSYLCDLPDDDPYDEDDNEEAGEWDEP